MPETKSRYGDVRPVHSHHTFVEGLMGIAAIRDYTKWRRQRNMGEDAVVAYFYDELLRAVREAAEEDPDGFDHAQKVAAVPGLFMGDDNES